MNTNPHATHNPPLFELRNISHRFGSQHVLRDVSFSVRAGETLAIIGESGCGKSVTLKTMMALLTPDRGEVHWRGRPVRSMRRTERNRERLKIGYLFQNAALFDSLSVYENIAFGLRQNTDLRARAIQQIVRERLVDVGLPFSIAEKFPAELSGGMRKRVALARALALMPEVMFYDEPTTGLDPIMSDVINELILATRSQRGVTSIVVTHDMRTVERVADRILMLYPLPRLHPHESQIIFQGSPEEAFSTSDPRVHQFLHGEAGDRLSELATL